MEVWLNIEIKMFCNKISVLYYFRVIRDCVIFFCVVTS